VGVFKVHQAADELVFNVGFIDLHGCEYQ
jgi:hypothetical protein